jgi:hypothetical protein
MMVVGQAGLELREVSRMPGLEHSQMVLMPGLGRGHGGHLRPGADGRVHRRGDDPVIEGFQGELDFPPVPPIALERVHLFGLPCEVRAVRPLPIAGTGRSPIPRMKSMWSNS